MFRRIKFYLTDGIDRELILDASVNEIPTKHAWEAVRQELEELYSSELERDRWIDEEYIY
jgi:hypothetical protein